MKFFETLQYNVNLLQSNDDKVKITIYCFSIRVVTLLIKHSSKRLKYITEIIISFKVLTNLEIFILPYHVDGDFWQRENIQLSLRQ